ncbi:hypothetical protein P8C59_001055 [Phyllachora maydis]|uniref:Uncharacterized protein n=1 Tax=Phyllachora maydis TaxID=1825666 RepID=A0AAD9HXM5_9PEZI|nr:hypothetical protein P8C59_001055 [Phyllachora maydis]
MLFLRAIAVLALLAAGTAASLHSIGACVGKRSIKGWTLLLLEETKCACDHYTARQKGSEWWNSCPDCYFDGTFCNSPNWHIGGDELNYYCEELCHASSSEAND